MANRSSTCDGDVRERVRIRIFERELVERPRRSVLDGDVLHGLQRQVDTAHVTCDRLAQPVHDVLRTGARSASGLGLIENRPLFIVVFVPSTPMNDDKLATAGSRRITRATSCCSSAIRAKTTSTQAPADALDHAGVLQEKESFGITM